MIDSSTRRSSGGDGPRVYGTLHSAVTSYSRRGSKTKVTQEYVAHNGAVGTSVGSARAAARHAAHAQRGATGARHAARSAEAAGAARASRRDEAGQRPVRHNATARVEAAQQAKDRAAGIAASATGFFEAHKLPCIIVGIVIAVVVFLYGPAATYYRAWRASLDLQAQYETLAQSNDQIQQQNDALLTREGIEEEARRRGYVGEGETGVVVEGLPDDSSDSSAVTPDYPWFVGIGDVIFGYEAK